MEIDLILPTYNILIGKWTENDKQKLFGFWDHSWDEKYKLILFDKFVGYKDKYGEGDEFLEKDLTLRYPQLLKELGLYPSVTQARNNGWDKDIPPGFTELKFKRKNIMGCMRIYIWKVPENPPWDNPVDDGDPRWSESVSDEQRVINGTNLAEWNITTVEKLMEKETNQDIKNSMRCFIFDIKIKHQIENFIKESKIRMSK